MISVGDARILVQRQMLTGLAAIGTAALLGLALFKATAPLLSFPAWDVDPMSIPPTAIGLGPTATMAIDCSIITLAGVIMALTGPLVGRPRFVEIFLLLAGLIAVAWHGVFAPAATQPNLLLGISWAAAISAAAALSHAARIDLIRRLGAAIAIGLIAMLAFKGAAQVWVEVPDTIAAFEADRPAILAAHGWSPDSFAAKTFERRLRDATATGWFGLANIVASFGAAGFGFFIVLCLETGAKGSRKLAAILGIVLSLLCVWMAGSKGGWAAAAVACFVALAGPRIAAHRAPRGSLLLVFIPLAALALVFARGIVGTRLGELSLLFRSFYLSAAAKIFGHNVLAGIGPANFKDSYLLSKNPLSPEEISSPHSVFFDFAATLGAGGVLWGVLLLALIGSAGVALALPPDSHETEEPRNNAAALRPALLTLALVSLGGAWIEMPLATPLNGLVRIGGLFAAGLLAWRVCCAGERALGVALCAATSALAFHAMIEVTPVQQGSTVLFGCLIGLAAASLPALPQARRGIIFLASPGLALGVIGIGASLLIGRVQDWESLLRSGADRLAPFADLNARINEAARTGNAQDAAGFKAAAIDLGAILGKSLNSDPRDLRRALLEAKIKRGDEALADLVMAIAVDPTNFETRQAASQLALGIGAMLRELGQSGEERLRQGLEFAEDATQLKSRKAPAYAWLGSARRGVYELTREKSLLRGAFDAWQAASAFDPHNPLHAAACARVAIELGDKTQAKDWAIRALRLNENMRLDPLRQFETGERRRLEAIASPVSAP